MKEKIDIVSFSDDSFYANSEGSYNRYIYEKVGVSGEGEDKVYDFSSVLYDNVGSNGLRALLRDRYHLNNEITKTIGIGLIGSAMAEFVSSHLSIGKVLLQNNFGDTNEDYNNLKMLGSERVIVFDDVLRSGKKSTLRTTKLQLLGVEVLGFGYLVEDKDCSGRNELIKSGEKDIYSVILK